MAGSTGGGEGPSAVVGLGPGSLILFVAGNVSTAASNGGGAATPMQGRWRLGEASAAAGRSFHGVGGSAVVAATGISGRGQHDRGPMLTSPSP